MKKLALPGKIFLCVSALIFVSFPLYIAKQEAYAAYEKAMQEKYGPNFLLPKHNFGRYYPPQNDTAFRDDFPSQEAYPSFSKKDFFTEMARQMDVFRHAYSSGIQALNGNTNVEALGLIVELFASNKTRDMIMDLYNNAVGRRIGDESDTPEELARNLIEAMKAGKFIVDSRTDHRLYGGGEGPFDYYVDMEKKCTVWEVFDAERIIRSLLGPEPNMAHGVLRKAFMEELWLDTKEDGSISVRPVP